jgi:hypothetical protein
MASYISFSCIEALEYAQDKDTAVGVGDNPADNRVAYYINNN